MGKAKRYYSSEERKAYWIGVGISAERHGDGEKVLDSRSTKIRNSVRKGYEADNHKDLSGKFANKR